MRTYFSPWQTSTANVTKPFLRKPVHPIRLNIGTLQNLPSCFHTSRFKSITSIHCQRPLQKHVNNRIDNVNGVTFVTRKHMSPQGPIFITCRLIQRIKDQSMKSLSWYFTNVYKQNKQNITCLLVDTNFNLLVFNSIFHSFPALTREISTWTLEDKIRIH